MRRAYLDCNATTPIRKEARAALLEHLDAVWGNPSSVHSFGHRSRMAIESARESVAALLGAEPRDVVLTSGGTEANNLAIYGVAHAAAPEARRIVSSAFEHPSVDRVLHDLESRGFEVVRVRPDASGRVDARAMVEAAEQRRTALVSLMLANNETGTLQPVDDVARALRGTGIPVHCDAAQGAGRVPVDVSRIGADLLSVAAHKMGGPQGIGALVVRQGLRIEPHLRGGGQELNRRPGTESVALTAAFGAAAEAARKGLEPEGTRIATLRDRLERGTALMGVGARVNGAASPRLPNTTSLYLPGVSAESLVCALDLEGVAVSAGSACSAGTARRSASLLAMGLVEEASASIRISLGPMTTEEEIETFLAVLPGVLERMSVRAAPDVRSPS
jgi:cysteine desulfurase